MEVKIIKVCNVREYEEMEIQRNGFDYSVSGNEFILNARKKEPKAPGEGINSFMYFKSDEKFHMMRDMDEVLRLHLSEYERSDRAQVAIPASPATSYFIVYSTGGESHHISLDTSFHWKAVAFMLAKDIRNSDHVQMIKKIPGKSKGRRLSKKLPIARFMKPACKLLRELRDEHGIVFRLKGHALNRLLPEDLLRGSFDDLNPLWAKDRVFRACVLTILRTSIRQITTSFSPRLRGHPMDRFQSQLLKAPVIEAELVTSRSVDPDYKGSDLLKLVNFVPIPVMDTCTIQEAMNASSNRRRNLARRTVSRNSLTLSSVRSTDIIVLSSWSQFRDYVEGFQHYLVRRLIKPFRRRLAEGKMSVRLACCLASFNQLQQDKLNKMPVWFLKYTSDLNRYTGHILLMAQTLGRSKFEKLLYGSKKTGESGQLRLLADTMSRCPELIERRLIPHTPKNIRHLIKLHEAWHDNNSALRRAYSAIKTRDIWIFDELPEGLPDIGEVSCRVIKTGEEYREEGNTMTHCVGSYAGSPAFTAHLERGEDAATLMVSKSRFSTQCYGKHNSVNKLVTDIREKWIPVLQPMVDAAATKTSEMEKQQPIQVYDNENSGGQDRPDREGKSKSGRDRNHRKSRKKGARARAGKPGDRKSKRGAKGDLLPGGEAAPTDHTSVEACAGG